MEFRNQNSNQPLQFSWAVAIFAARETPDELMCAIDAVIKAADATTVIDVMVNGNATLSTSITELLSKNKSASTLAWIRVWSLVLGDKAHAWNQYVHTVWPQAQLSFFVDGYVEINPNALLLLSDSLKILPRSLGATGIPTTGRTAAKLRVHMLAEGGMHGNLFALKESVMHQLRQIRFHLPLGIYRTDSTIGAVLAFGLDPSKNEWDVKNRIFIHPDVSWKTPDRKWWRYAEVNSQIKRVLRQAQGVLENQAVENFLARRRLAPADLPQTVSELVLDWVNRCPEKAKSILWKSPLSRVALKNFQVPKDWSSAKQPPRLVSTWPNEISFHSS